MKNCRMTLYFTAIALSAALTAVITVKSEKTAHADAETQWEITQLGNPEEGPELCYVITGEEGLAIVDGGLGGQEDRLREIIADYDDQVDTWILTHPHDDHITAFLDIYEDLQGIEISHVYAPEWAEPEILAERTSWEDYSYLETFQSLEIPGLEYVHPGDEKDVLGLKMEILSAYDENIHALSKDVLNDGSMMFRLTGREESMLFCADVGSAEKRSRKKMSKYLIEKYGADLKSDYIQMGHHGFGGLNEKFYKLVAPRMAFFDAPDWEMNGEDPRINTLETTGWMETLGAEIRSFHTAPNTICLR